MTPANAKAYLTTQVRTSDPLGLVIALYEEAIASVTRAMDAIEAEKPLQRGQALNKAAEIIMLLSESLDFTQTPGLSGRLFAQYTFMLSQLLEANRSDDLEPLQSVKSSLSILLSAWQEIGHSDEVLAMNARAEQLAAKRPRLLETRSNGRPGVTMFA